MNHITTNRILNQVRNNPGRRKCWKGLQCVDFVAERGAGKERPVEGSVIKKMGCEFPLVSVICSVHSPEVVCFFSKILVLQAAL